ncbi:MAG: helicase C-terminal domain-containing protein [Candidatus Syntrophopropionicum ammoniitolerans]
MFAGPWHRRQHIRLLGEFKAGGRLVLFGSLSFWEGIDVPGEALTCVIIVKLPFSSPAQPIIEARLEDLASRGQDGFRLLSIPQAIIRFKQGFGRLIRSSRDDGCVVVLDGRLLSRNYGRQFLVSLPIKRHLRGDVDFIAKKIYAWLKDNRDRQLQS